VKTLKKVGELEGHIGVIKIGLDSLCPKTPIITPRKNEPFSQKTHLKIPHPGFEIVEF
jgi:hypothetical protein